MKKTICLLTFFSLLTLFACEKTSDVKMTIETDCTGTYLRQDGKDYKVCNIGKVAGFSDGQAVSVTYKNIGDCNIVVGDGCKLVHKNEGWIEVLTIK
jgi:hypothetical protein